MKLPYIPVTLTLTVLGLLLVGKESDNAFLALGVLCVAFGAAGLVIFMRENEKKQ